MFAVMLLLSLFSLASTSPAPALSDGWWVPPQHSTWQWQITGTVDTTVDAEVYDIDLFDATPALVAQLHAQGRHVICYFDVGAWESYRPDAADFPSIIIGKTTGWNGERYLDVRRIDLLEPVMAKRFDMCKAKGFDAVEPDYLDHYTNRTGFPITYSQQITFNTWVAGMAHNRGLGVAMKNDVEQVDALVNTFDFALNEQCFQYSECDPYKLFIAQGKAVYQVEYKTQTANFCPQANALGFMAMRKKLDLGVPRWSCWSGN